MKRYVDEVCMVITDSFTAPLRIDETETKLTEAAMAADDQSLERLFQMDSHVEHRRRELEDTRAKMVAARKSIADFIGGDAMPPLKKRVVAERRKTP